MSLIRKFQRIRKQYLTNRHNICTNVKYNDDDDDDDDDNNNNNNSVYFRLSVHGLSLCGLSAHCRKLLMLNDEGGK